MYYGLLSPLIPAASRSMAVVSPEALKEAILKLQPRDTEPLWPLEDCGTAKERDVFLLPCAALLRVLDLPRPASAPKGGLGSVTKAFNSALATVLKPATPSIVFDPKHYSITAAEGMMSAQRFSEHNRAVAEHMGLPDPDPVKPRRDRVKVLRFTIAPPGPLLKQLPAAVCEALHAAALLWVPPEPGSVSNKRKAVEPAPASGAAANGTLKRIKENLLILPPYNPPAWLTKQTTVVAALHAMLKRLEQEVKEYKGEPAHFYFHASVHHIVPCIIYDVDEDAGPGAQAPPKPEVVASCMVGTPAAASSLTSAADFGRATTAATMPALEAAASAPAAVPAIEAAPEPAALAARRVPEEAPGGSGGQAHAPSAAAPGVALAPGGGGDLMLPPLPAKSAGGLRRMRLQLTAALQSGQDMLAIPSAGSLFAFHQDAARGQKMYSADLLASGGHGDVYRSTSAGNPGKVAFKVPKATTTFYDFNTECKVWEETKQRQCLRIARYYGLAICTMTLLPAFMTELGTTNLSDHVQRTFLLCSTEGMAVTDAKRMGFNILVGLVELHIMNTAHRDVKPENVILTGGDDTAKLIDLGIAKNVCQIETGTPFTMICTRDYAAPEQLRMDCMLKMRRSYGIKVHSWGWGATFLFMATNKVPWSHTAKRCAPVEEKLEALEGKDVRELLSTYPRPMGGTVSDWLGEELSIDPNVYLLMLHHADLKQLDSYADLVLGGCMPAEECLEGEAAATKNPYRARP